MGRDNFKNCFKKACFSKNKSRVEIFEAFNLNSNVSIDDDISAHFEQNTLNLVRKISDCLKKSSSKADQKTAQELTEIASINLASIQLLEKIFLYGKSAKSPFTAKLGKFSTKK